MPEISDYSKYQEFETPGLYEIVNQSSGTYLDLFHLGVNPDGSVNEKIVGFHGKSTNNDNQKWQIAEVGNNKYMIICRQRPCYVKALGDGFVVMATGGYPDHIDKHWTINKPDAKNPQLTEFYSVLDKGAVLELKDGSSHDDTDVMTYRQNSARKGQKWLLKKITK